MKSKSMLLALAAIFVFGVAMAGSAGAETVLRIGTISNDANQLDPHKSVKSQDKILFPMLFNGLVRFKPGSADLTDMEPDLAESWSTSPNGLVWTFKLRKGVQFHGGYGTLTAEDVVYSLGRAGDKKFSSAYKGYQDFESVVAVDDYTVRITLKRPVPSLLGLVVNYHGGMIVSKKATEELGDKFKLNPIGTGPFAFSDYKPKRSVTLMANKEYFRGAPKIDKIEYRYLPDVSSRELAFKKGEIDLFYAPREQRWVERMAKNPKAKVDVIGLGELRTLHLNTAKKPLDDIRIRKAIAHAINRDEMVAFIGPNVSREAFSVVPNGYQGHSSNVPRYEYNPAKAKALLKEAGYAKGLKLNAVITKVITLRQPMEIIQEQLRRVNVELDLEVVEHSAFHKMIRDDASAVVLYGAARFPVADVYLTQFYHSESIVGTPTAITNFSHSKIADAEITAARSETDAVKQDQLWEKAQQKILAESYSVPIFEQLIVWCRKPNLDYGYTLKDSISNGPVITEMTRFK